MSDISDLEGIFPSALRWNAEDGFLARSVFNEATGERELREIELDTAAATFAADLATRARGYGKVKVGFYDMILAPVGMAPPAWPGDQEYKAALGMWVWNPPFGELRIETNAALFRGSLADLWDRSRGFEEAKRGMQPVMSPRARFSSHR